MVSGLFEGFGKLWNLRGDIVYKGYFKGGKSISGKDFAKMNDDISDDEDRGHMAKHMYYGKTILEDGKGPTRRHSNISKSILN